MSNGKVTVDLFDLACIQENINLYGTEHGKPKPFLKDRQYIKRNHTEFSLGIYQDKYFFNFMGSDEWEDWWDNFKFCKTKDKFGTFMAHVHHGFDEQYQTVKPIVAQMIGDLKLDDFIIGGHSLGGAVATCMALDYIKKKKFSIRTFGCPRVMDFPTARYFNKNIEVSKRFVYRNDLVTHVPTAMMNFVHPKGLIPLGHKSFWNTISIRGSADDHEPEYYKCEIEKILGVAW